MNNCYNPYSLENKLILVTGASSGIGKAIAIECSKMGARLVISARNEERLLDTYSNLEGEGHKIVVADLSEEEGVDIIVNNIPKEINGIVQCAGLTIPKPFHFFSKEDIQNIMGVNFEAPVFLTQRLYKKKKIAKQGSVVFISSISGVLCSSVAGSIYSASKGAINGIAKGLAIEFATKGIRVNCVNPGMINTNIFSEGTISEDQLKEDMKKYPLKRYGMPEEVAHAVIYLLSDASSWTTGANLVIDGGYTLL
ncbi:SDR family oxidoreductase [Bacteroidales bacterium OttesenSCG-928-L03]|nr:SDR family oxidoreductase [Bacteroidales bacterium OttesenSCG-928-L03]